MKVRFKTYIIILFLTTAFSRLGFSQSYCTGFEDGEERNRPWMNIHVLNDSSAYEGIRLCICDSVHEFGFGFQVKADEAFPMQNINCQFGVWCKNVTNRGETTLVVSLENSGGNVYWNGYPLSSFADGTMDWFPVTLNLNLPHDYLKGATLKVFFWNPNRNVLYLDDARLAFLPTPILDYLPPVPDLPKPDCPLVLSDSNGQALTLPIRLVTEFVTEGADTLPSQSHYLTNWDSIGENRWRSEDDGLGYCILSLRKAATNRIDFDIESHFNHEGQLLRQTLVIPFTDSTLSLYRRNQHIDSSDFQGVYYLDREGFVVGEGMRTVATYHNTGISSLQFDAINRTAYFNLDYWRDHPLIHYPLDNDTSDYFINISCRHITPETVIKGHFSLSIGAEIRELPRIMPVWDGYESAFIFTEHADWTDLRTHRAVLFGNEHITDPKEAVGGFVHFDVPVTKSVFFNNPDHVTNSETTGGLFPNEHATLKGDRTFLRLMEALHRLGFDICLHTPEQYSTTSDNLNKALRFMRFHFSSPSWIDHGYNNNKKSNRENMVCDGLVPNASQYAAPSWKRYGVRYLWNAYYEENRMSHLNFDGHFVQPYDGFSDALPNRQVTTLPNGDPDFLLWATPSTLEINEDHEWYYYFEPKRLQHLVDSHHVFITHTYPAWTDPYRAFWTYNADSTAVAMPGFNYALQQLADLREAKKMMTTTVKDYLNHYESLIAVDYVILENGDIQLINHGRAIDGFTLLCQSPIFIEGKTVDFRKVGNEYLIWFKINRKETVNIHFL